VFEKPEGVEGMSSWQHLLAELREDTRIHITQLRLQLGGATAVCITGAPGYVQCTEVQKAMLTGKSRTRQCVGTVLPGGGVILSWMDNGGNVWQDIRMLDEGGLRLHAWLKTE
jgi:hypothetical protein